MKASSNRNLAPCQDLPSQPEQEQAGALLLSSVPKQQAIQIPNLLWRLGGTETVRKGIQAGEKPRASDSGTTAFWAE